jgi:hypothetical protein
MQNTWKEYRMAHILGRLIFVLWILAGFSTFFSGLAGWDDGVLIFGISFVSPIVASLIYVAAKWIITGESD